MKTSVCLCMIVKDESSIIRRCFDSVKPLIDYWVIVDTGSSDGTRNIVKEFSNEVPGELHEIPWKNFAWNRSEAIKLARSKADYTLIIDADEVLKMPDGYTLPELTADYYNILTNYNGLLYHRIQLVKNSIEWRYESIIHEYITCEDIEHRSKDVLKYVENRPTSDGNRSRDPYKYKRDALLLENAMLENPTNTRYMFYLAQSYRDCQEYENAITWYKKRAEAGGWKQEVYFSYYSIAKCMETLGKPWTDVMEYYILAYNTLPHRLEPLYDIVKHYRILGMYMVANGFINMQVNGSMPDDLFMDISTYNYAFWDECYIVNFYLGRYAEAYDLIRRLFTDNRIPTNHILRMYFNMDAIKGPLKDKYDPIKLNIRPDSNVVLISGASQYGQTVVANLLSIQNNTGVTIDRYVAHMNVSDTSTIKLNDEQINILLNNLSVDPNNIASDASSIYLPHIDYIASNSNIKIVLVKYDDSIINIGGTTTISNADIDALAAKYPNKVFACNPTQLVESHDYQKSLYDFIGIKDARVRVSSFVNVLE